MSSPIAIAVASSHLLLAVSWGYASALAGVGLLLGFAIGRLALTRQRRLIRTEIQNQLNLNLPAMEKHLQNLLKMGSQLTELESAVERVFTRVRAELRSGGLLSAVLALAGLIIGIVGGLFADWVAHGHRFLVDGIWVRGAVITAIAIVVALVAAWAATRILGSPDT